MMVKSSIWQWAMFHGEDVPLKIAMFNRQLVVQSVVIMIITVKPTWSNQHVRVRDVVFLFNDMYIHICLHAITYIVHVCTCNNINIYIYTCVFHACLMWDWLNQLSSAAGSGWNHFVFLPWTPCGFTQLPCAPSHHVNWGHENSWNTSSGVMTPIS